VIEHSPSQILQRLVINSGNANEPGLGPWPLSYSQMPSSPSNFLTLYDTQGVPDGRLMPTGKKIIHPGLQLRVRATTHQISFLKANGLAQYFDTVLRASVVLGAKTYRVQNISRTGDPISLGQEEGTTRILFTVNMIATILELI
jgi:hypothetical protein